MKKETLTIFIFLATLILITVPLIMLTSGAQTDSFSANVTVGNSAPEITWVNDSVNASPNAATTKEIQIRFNATDGNGVSDFNDSTAQTNISKNGVIRSSHICSPAGFVGTMESWLCNVTIYYYDQPGEWVITAYIEDLGGNYSTNTTSNFTMGNTDDIDVIETALTFSGSAGENDVAASENPLTINNTGNQDYTSINMTGYNLTGGGNTIGATAFAVNISNSGGPGEALQHNAPITITDANLSRGLTEDLYFFLDIPSGIANTDYDTGGTPWTIDPVI
ncbi:hypothetical protein AYK26_06330 [Euryarchaeota archaeon SM23-78]|nr:MAG: hypothetical protein AYK26_06330 [Euryarchaeota archaeon SM23-78]MBW3001052.1 hypothetical protein [Candidatus Woesearchaeota archaeon]